MLDCSHTSLSETTGKMTKKVSLRTRFSLLDEILGMCPLGKEGGTKPIHVYSSQKHPTTLGISLWPKHFSESILRRNVDQRLIYNFPWNEIRSWFESYSWKYHRSRGYFSCRYPGMKGLRPVLIDRWSLYTGVIVVTSGEHEVIWQALW